MRRQSFTLIEMLTVISLIVVMMGILLAAVSGVQRKVKNMKAYTMMKQLEAAISAYQSTYNGILPFTLACGTANSIVICAQPGTSPAIVQTFAAATSGTVGTGTSAIYSSDSRWRGEDTYQMLLKTLSAQDSNLNPRQQKFLELDNSTSPYTTGNYKDPWGNNFVVALDLDYSGAIANNASSPFYLAGADTGVTKDMAIWSLGKDAKQTMGGSSTSANNKDNINSWTSR